MAHRDESIGEVSETKGRVGIILAGLAIAALAVFAIQNTEKVEVEFLWFGGRIPIFLVIFVTVVLTLIISVVAAWVGNRRSRRT
ncbi:MAG: hypothetical protein ACKVKO_01345 [Acidimicrobiales bacterium]|jgi:uncharacterized integral membrane protein